MDGLSLDEQYQIVRIVSRLQRLQQLDVIWTLHLQSATQIQLGDVGTLQSLTNEMRGLLEQVPVDAMWIHDFIHKDPQRIDIDVTLYDFLVDPSQGEGYFPAEYRRRLMIMHEREPFSVTLDRASAYLFDNSSAVKDQIQEKIDKISQGQFTQGDFPAPFSCAGLFVTSTLAVIVGTHIPPLLPVGGSGYIEFFRQNCPETFGHFLTGWKHKH